MKVVKMTTNENEYGTKKYISEEEHLRMYVKNIYREIIW